METTTPHITSTESSHPADGSSTQTVRQIPKPVDIADRIQTVDLVRGFALLGILMMNIPLFGINNNHVQDIVNGPHTTADYWTLATVSSLFEGSMRGLFSMLFGAGMILFTMNKKDSPTGITVTEYYYRRLLLLVLFGLINAYVFLWEGDILFYYGLAGMLLFPFRKMKARWLIALGVLCIAIGIYKNMGWFDQLRDNRAGYKAAIAAEKKGEKPTEKQAEQRANWTRTEENFKPDTAQLNTDIREMRGNYPTVFSHMIPRNSGNETWGTFHGIWDMLCMMFIGMGLFVLGFFSNKMRTSTYAMTLMIGYGIGIPLGWISFDQGLSNQIANIGNYVDSYRVPHWILYDFKRLLLAIGHASLLMLVFRSGIMNSMMKGLSNVGQMAFTNYLMQSLICTFIFFGYGFGYYNKLAFWQLYVVVAAVWVFQLIFSAIWLRYFRFGPFEWLWRSATYWQKQPMRK